MAPSSSELPAGSLHHKAPRICTEYAAFIFCLTALSWSSFAPCRRLWAATRPCSLQTSVLVQGGQVLSCPSGSVHAVRQGTGSLGS